MGLFPVGRTFTGNAMWAIQANIVRETPTGTTSRQVPTFYLDERVQGIVDEKHAKEIAKGILLTALDIEERLKTKVYGTAVKVD